MKFKIVCDEQGLFYIKKKVKYLPIWYNFEEDHFYGIEKYRDINDAYKRICDLKEMENKRKKRLEESKRALKDLKIDC